MPRRLRLIALSLCLGVAFLAFAQKRSITEKDLFQFNWIGDPQISPDGSQVAFVKVTVNEKKEGYDTSLWSVPIGGDEVPRRLTNNNHDSSPRWSPDGKWLAFIRSPEPTGTQPGAGGSAGSRTPAAQLYLMPMSGGESWRVTDLPKGVSSPVWSPDSKAIAFTSTTSPEDTAKQSREKQKAAEKDEKKPEHDEAEKNPEEASQSKPAGPEPEHESDVRVITRAVYRFNGEGYADPSIRNTSGWSLGRRVPSRQFSLNSSPSGSSRKGIPSGQETAARSISPPSACWSLTTNCPTPISIVSAPKAANRPRYSRSIWA